MPKNVVVYTGATSNLFTTLIKNSPPDDVTFHALSSKPISDEKVKMLSHNGVKVNGTLPIDAKIALWLATPFEGDKEILENAREKYEHVLFTGSAMQIDDRYGIETGPKQLRMSQVQGVTTIVSGFYLQDLPPAFPGSGMQAPTWSALVGTKKDVTIDCTLDEKSSVTPISVVIDLILEFIKDPNSDKFKKTVGGDLGINIACTDFEVSARDLKCLIAGENIPEPKPDPTYTVLPHSASVTYEDLRTAVMKAKSIELANAAPK